MRFLCAQRRHPVRHGLVAADDFFFDQRFKPLLERFLALQHRFGCLAANDIELRRRRRIEQPAQFDLLVDQLPGRILQ